MIRSILLFTMLLLSLPRTIEAMIHNSSGCGSSNIPAPYVVHTEKTAGKGGLFERLAEKAIHKRLKKMINAIGEGRESYGTGMAIWGLILGLLGAFSFVFIFYTAFIPPLIFGLAGLTLSICGLAKGSGWQNNRLARRLAIAGIILNTLVLVVAVASFGLF